MKSSHPNEESHSFTDYQRYVRDKASDSFRELRGKLETRPGITPEEKMRSRSLSPARQVTGAHVQHADYSYGASVNKLRNMLRQYNSPVTTPKTVQFSEDMQQDIEAQLAGHDGSTIIFGPSPASNLGSFTPNTDRTRYPGTNIPGPEQILPLLNNTSALVTQLESENAYLKGELQVLKRRLEEVILENRMLHDELKKSTMQDIMSTTSPQHAIPSLSPEMKRSAPEKLSATESNRPMTVQDYGKWQRELEKLNVMHSTKASTLEAQLSHAREERDQLEKEVEVLKKKVRIHESFTGMDPGVIAQAGAMCLHCAQNEAMIPSARNSRHRIDIVARERDEAVEQLTRLRNQCDELKQREDEAFLQVKQSIHVVEQVHLEQTQVLIQKEQLKEELTSMRQRMEDHAQDMQEKMTQERQLVRQELQTERTELIEKITNLTESLVAAENQLQKLARDKNSLMSELNGARDQINNFDTDYGQATDTMKVGITQARLERNAATGKLKKFKQEMQTLEREMEQEKSRLKAELEDVRRRLGHAEKDLVDSKEQCIQLTHNMQSLEREAHLSKLTRESIERNRSDDLKNIQKRAEHREAELNMMIDTIESKHVRAQGELGNIVDSHTNLVHKLREECRRLAAQLESVSTKYKTKNRKLRSENQQLSIRLEQLTNRTRNHEEQQTQQVQLQEKMRIRLQNMDEHAQHSGQQIVEMLARESALMRDRKLLAKEVEFLRQHLVLTDSVQLSTSHREAIDDVITAVRNEANDKSPVIPI